MYLETIVKLKEDSKFQTIAFHDISGNALLFFHYFYVIYRVFLCTRTISRHHKDIMPIMCLLHVIRAVCSSEVCCVDIDVNGVNCA